MSFEVTEKPPIEFFDSFIGFVNGKTTDTFYGKFWLGGFVVSFTAKYRIIIMKLCIRKCEIKKKIEICIYVMIKKNYCVYVMLKKNVMHTETKKPRNHWAKIFHKKYRWFYGDRHRKTTASQKKVSVVLPLTKPINDFKNSIGGISWLRLTTHVGGFVGFYRFTNGERTHRWFLR